VRRFMRTLVLCACAASALVNPVYARADDDAARIAAVFTESIREYVKRSPAARADGRQSELFSPKVAEYFQKIVRKAFRGKNGRHMRRTILEGDPVRQTVLHVNDVYPEDIPLTTMPPTLLERLPALPAELAYRIIGRALVLQDLKTNVIVDFIPNALPRFH